MKRIILIFVICFSGIKGYAQLFDVKSNLYLGYQTGKYLGPELFKDQGTIAPSFYSNFKTTEGFVLKGLSKISAHMSTGLTIGVSEASDWQSNNYTSYVNATAISVSFMPVFQYHSAFKETGLFNRLKLYGEFAPVLGYSIASLPGTLFSIGSSEEGSNPAFKNHEMTYGLQLGFGCSFAFTNKFGLFMDASLQQSFINSHLYLDYKYILSGITIGTYMNLYKVKRFNY